MTPSLKPIKSVSPMKHLSTMFGEMLGLGIKAELETESGFFDMRSVDEYIAIYKNPLNLMVFGWTSPALSEHLTPSVRYHKMTTLFEPAQSSTKELGLEFKVGVATKVIGQAMIKYHTLAQKPISSLTKTEITEIMTNPTLAKLGSALSPLKIVSQSISTQVHQRRQQILEEVIGQLESSSLESTEVTGFTLSTSLILKSTRPRTFTYVLTAATGSNAIPESKKIHQEWNLVLESQVPQTPVKTIRVRGHANMPILPLWNIEELRQTLINFEFNNQMTFTMANGEKSQVITTGTAKTTETQKSFSLESPEALKLKVAGPTGSILSAKATAELEELVRVQASTLDKVVFETKYVNVPKVFERMEMTFVEMLKIYLWPYYTPSKSTVENTTLESGNYKTTTEVTFRQETPSFDLKITMPTQKFFFTNVRIAYPFSLFFPVTALRNNVHLGLSKVVSGSVLSTKTCRMDSNTLVKFDGKPLNLPFGDMPEPVTIAADFSTFHRFAVNVQRTHYLYNTDIILKKNKIQVRYTSGNVQLPIPQLLVNGKPMEIEVGRNIIAKDIDDQSDIATISMASDHYLVIRAPRFLLKGVIAMKSSVIVAPSAQLKGKISGLCGNIQTPIVSQSLTGQCVYSRPELEIAAWTIPTGESSSSISPSIRTQLKKETEICSKITVQPTQVAKAYKAFTGKCTVLRHYILPTPSFLENEMCVSQVPLPTCGPSCRPQNSEMIEKVLPFTCLNLDGGNVDAKRIERMVRRGELVPELEGLPTDIMHRVRMPAHCTHALVTPISGN